MDQATCVTCIKALDRPFQGHYGASYIAPWTFIFSDIYTANTWVESKSLKSTHVACLSKIHIILNTNLINREESSIPISFESKFRIWAKGEFQEWKFTSAYGTILPFYLCQNLIWPLSNTSNNSITTFFRLTKTYSHDLRRSRKLCNRRK